jgi:hypothetical protein
MKLDDSHPPAAVRRDEATDELLAASLAQPLTA